MRRNLRMSHHIMITLSFLLVSLFAGSLSADTVTLKGAIDLALKTNSKVAIARAKMKESHARVNEAWSKLWPDLSIDASGTRMDSESGLNSLVDGEESVDFIKGTLFFNPGSFFYSLQSARAGYVASVEEARRTHADTVLQTVTLFYKVMLAQEMVTLTSNSFRTLSENLRIVSLSFQAGSGLNLDLLRSKVSMANQRTKLIMAKNDLRNVQAAFNIHLGRDWDTEMSLDRSAIGLDRSELSSLTNLSSEMIKQRIDELSAIALKDRPEMIQITMKKKISKAGARANQALYLCPSFFASGSYGMSKAESKSDAIDYSKFHPSTLQVMGDLMPLLVSSGWNHSWNFTVGATYKFGSLAPWDSAHARVAQSESQAEQAGIELEDLAKNIKTEVQQKYNKLLAAAAVILSQQDNISSAEEYVRVATIQFQNGIIDNAKFLSADLEYQNAKALNIQAFYDFQTAKAELNKAVGQDLFSIGE